MPKTIGGGGGGGAGFGGGGETHIRPLPPSPKPLLGLAAQWAAVRPHQPQREQQYEQ